MRSRKQIMLDKVFKVVDFVIKPIKSEWVFFFAFMVLNNSWHSAYNPLWLSLGVLISYLFTLIIYLTKSRIVKGVFYTFGFVLFTLYVFLRLVMGTYLSSSILQTLVETNSSETGDFFSSFISNPWMILTIVIIVISIALVIYVEINKKRIEAYIIRRWGRLYRIASVVLCLMLFAGVYQSHVYVILYRMDSLDKLEQDWEKIKLYRNVDMITTLIHSAKCVYSAANEVNNAEQVAKDVYSTAIQRQFNEPTTLIYVLGESFIKSHSNVYGYDLETTPYMKSLENSGNLFAFTNVATDANFTSRSEKNTFSTNNVAERESPYRNPLFPTVFRHAGFNVSFWDIQRDYWGDGVVAFSVNFFLYNSAISSYSYDLTNQVSFGYDGELIDDFYKKEKQDRPFNLVMFHFNGQHFDATSRYPHTKEFTKFSAKDVTRTDSYLTDAMRRDIAEYDNATYYNDCVMKKIIEHYKDKNAVLVYLSDHGEELYDYRPSKGRVMKPMNANLLKCQFEIPMVVWCSDKYKETHSDIVESIKASVNKPFMSYNISHMLFHLAGVKTVYYRSQRDLLSPDYKCQKRILYEGTDFDLVRFGKTID